MKYYLDTNICIYFLKGMNENIRRKLLEKHPDDIKICSIVKAELLYGAEKSIKKQVLSRVFGILILQFSFHSRDQQPSLTPPEYYHLFL